MTKDNQNNLQKQFHFYPFFFFRYSNQYQNDKAEYFRYDFETYKYQKFYKNFFKSYISADVNINQVNFGDSLYELLQIQENILNEVNYEKKFSSFIKEINNNEDFILNQEMIEIICFLYWKGRTIAPDFEDINKNLIKKMLFTYFDIPIKKNNPYNNKNFEPQLEKQYILEMCLFTINYFQKNDFLVKNLSNKVWDEIIKEQLDEFKIFFEKNNRDGLNDEQIKQFKEWLENNQLQSQKKSFQRISTASQKIFTSYKLKFKEKLFITNEWFFHVNNFLVDKKTDILIIFLNDNEILICVEQDLIDTYAIKDILNYAISSIYLDFDAIILFGEDEKLFELIKTLKTQILENKISENRHQLKKLYENNDMIKYLEYEFKKY